jgi:hypothetical protein
MPKGKRVRSRFIDKVRKQTAAIEQQLQLADDRDLIETDPGEKPTHEDSCQFYDDRNNYTPEIE